MRRTTAFGHSLGGLQSGVGLQWDLAAAVGASHAGTGDRHLLASQGRRTPLVAVPRVGPVRLSFLIKGSATSSLATGREEPPSSLFNEYRDNLTQCVETIGTNGTRRLRCIVGPRTGWAAPHFLVHLKWEFLRGLYISEHAHVVMLLFVLFLSQDALNSFGVA